MVFLMISLQDDMDILFSEIDLDSPSGHDVTAHTLLAYLKIQLPATYYENMPGGDVLV